MNGQIVSDMQHILHGYRKDGDVQDSIYDLADAIRELAQQNAALHERVEKLEKAK